MISIMNDMGPHEKNARHQNESNLKQKNSQRKKKKKRQQRLIHFALVVVGQDCVCLVDLCEAFLGLFLVGGRVRVMLLGERPVNEKVKYIQVSISIHFHAIVQMGEEKDGLDRKGKVQHRKEQ